MGSADRRFLQTRFSLGSKAQAGEGEAMTGISPPSEDRSRSRTSGESSFSDPELFQPSGRSLVPAATTMLRFTGSSPAPQRDTGYSSSSAASPPQRGPELSATQATFLAGAAVTHAHHASTVALGAATAAHQAAEREQATIAQAQDAVRHFAGHAAAAEVGFREQAQAIAQAAQGALDDARQREANLRQQAQIAIDTTTREAQQRVSAIQGEAQQAITQSNQSAQARIRLVEGEALGLSEALRQANQAREQAEAERKRAEDHAQQRERDYLRLAEDMEQMRRSHEEAMARVTARFQVISEQMAAHSRATPPQTPTRTHLSFPDMSFSPDTGQNDAVIHPTVPLIASVPEEQETLSTPPSAQPVGESTAPQEGAAAGAPGGATVSVQPAATTPPQETQLSSRVDELTKLVSDLATLVHATIPGQGNAAAPTGAAAGAPTQTAPTQTPQVPALSLGGVGASAPPPGSPNGNS